MEIISAVRKIRKRNGQVTRCAGSADKQNKVGSLGTSANGFLRQKFLPLFEGGTDFPDKKTTEKVFFESFAVLTELHILNSYEAVNKPYPYNILLAHHFAEKELCKSGQDIELSIVQDDNTGIKLAGKTIYNTGNTLYYIPVLPLYRLLQDKRQKKSAELLLSVFTYLYHIAGIPYYREEYSALGYHYECIEDWFFDEWEGDEKDELVAMQQELNKASHYGDIMFKKIYNPYHLNHFKDKIESFTLSDDFGQECLKITKKAFAIFEQYPNESIFRNTSNENFDEDNGIITAQQYISFIANNEGILYDNIERAVNDEFNECSEMEQPFLFQVYDNENNQYREGLDFEYKIFPLINDLCTLLNQIP
ncbi:hypothetical protein C8C83_4462 [Flavobacterium sp. 90]|uniref:hypothetical protein n=1 Tax=unclassified Flavobacterium TaxID=196869 RepID=UPI000EAFBBAC|nr:MULTISPECIES: hypothetical protein [unclassified Flavobacterium]RKR05130.1 hypothetical protein C8C82_4803 [Flavobacterium sp. 81]TCK56445.1 hypothetical protein C8C83_4462 [Flavobacterium sp. 90]